MLTGLYAGILGLWLVFLILSVVRLRWKHKVGLGAGGNDALGRAIRIHGNFVETVPFVLILMGLMEFYGYQAWLIHLAGILLILSRFLHWYGLRHSAGPSFGRMAGTICVLTVVVLVSALLVYNFIVA